jgi:hypothetical protein
MGLEMAPDPEIGTEPGLEMGLEMGPETGPGTETVTVPGTGSAMGPGTGTGTGTATIDGERECPSMWIVTNSTFARWETLSSPHVRRLPSSPCGPV